MAADSSDCTSPRAELAKPADAVDCALAGMIDPVFMSRQCGFHPGGNLHSDGIIINAWVVGGVARNERKRNNNV